MRALSEMLTHQNALRGIGIQQSRLQVEAIERQAKMLESQTGVWRDTFTRGAAILANYRLSTGKIQMMNSGLSELIVHEKLLGKSAEEQQQTYDAIGRAILQGNVRGLKSVGIELDANQQRLLQLYSRMGAYTQSIAMISKVIHQSFGGEAQRYMQSAEARAEMLGIRWKALRIEIGQRFLPLQEQLFDIYRRFIDVIGPYVIKTVDYIAKNFSRWAQIIN